jgi:rare lipoprotein A (peptidoglycan hydrolase)
MDEGPARRRAGTNRTRTTPGRLASRPDRIALWAVFLALFSALAAAASSAQAGSSGGISDPAEEQEAPPSAPPVCAPADFGERALKLGDCGADVKTLNWILKSKPFERGVGLGKQFGSSTDQTVRAFQEQNGLGADGVVEARTRKQLRRSMNKDVATWYGPEFFGNRTACGVRLDRRTVGVAHKDLPCGTKVTFAYEGKYLRTRVIDRGPYANGAKWDLTQAAARQLGFEVTDKIRAAPIKK